jgi:uncharacterized membrane protein YsdA (DUF1294 family)
MEFSLGMLGMLYIVLVSAVALFVMGNDKFAARRDRDERTPEGILFFLAVIGGSLGVYAGMFLFRHKTRKWYFVMGLPVLLAQQLLLLSQFRYLLF